MANKYTPATIDKSFVIPLYQRLFEWEEAEIIQLLNDLYSSFDKDPRSLYYIGLLTIYKRTLDEKYDLVDGQQRFTALSLMGIVFGWEEFLRSDDDYRLSFFARSIDQEYLINKIENKELNYINGKMEAAIKCIKNFVDDPQKSNIESFKNYIRTNTTFFLSELPQDYTVQDLNRYFEAMNEAGKGLENHEILKVQLLREGDDSKKETCTKIWNIVSEMDKCLIRQKEGELQKEYRNRNIRNLKESDSLFSLIENEKDDGGGDKITISQIKPSSTKPNESGSGRDEKAILSFSDFLLQVLWLCLPKNERLNSTNFFNKFKLLETFNQFIIEEGSLVEVDEFFNNLLRYRVLFDYFIIRSNNNDNRITNYSLNMFDDYQDDNQRQNLKTSLIHYQSMLNVSGQTYIWLTPFLEKLNENIEVDMETCLANLKDWDNSRQNNSNGLSLSYGSINRYWFWRLDYYLWENRGDLFDETSRKIANNYLFRSNRSIEHIAPQSPKRESKFKLEKGYLHSFGNLAMISAGQNSSLQNESFEVKRAHVESFLNDSLGGTIESLKMLNLHKYESWNEANLIEHHNNMIDVLIDSFKPTSKEFQTEFSEVIGSLEKNKFIDHA